MRDEHNAVSGFRAQPPSDSLNDTAVQISVSDYRRSNDFYLNDGQVIVLPYSMGFKAGGSCDLLTAWSISVWSDTPTFIQPFED